ncbi:hypothetical protein [Selenomonas ruminantium]|uniref:YD repeat-containing protein n=1 Tax=Selenomonas ruminantium TaxID=971 RepID=A0A1H0V812_SELRU|nr:YD repeat-containing protein [Selenomonas ruminantium]
MKEINPDGLITTHTYDEQNQCIHTQDNLGGEVCYNYTKEGWLKEKKTKQSEGKWQVEACEYDYQGRVLRKTVNGQETRYWYKDDSPVPCAMRTPCGDEFRYEYDETILS